MNDINLTLPDLPLKIKGKLMDHEGKLEEAEEQLHAAQGQTRQAGSLAEQNQANLAALEVRTWKSRDKNQRFLPEMEHLGWPFNSKDTSFSPSKPFAYDSSSAAAKQQAFIREYYAWPGGRILQYCVLYVQYCVFILS